MTVSTMRLACAAVILCFLHLLPAEASASGSQADVGRRALGGRYGVESIITESTYNLFLLHRNDSACPARFFYNYTYFIQAAAAFPKFGTTGSPQTRRRELAAFFGQTSHETTGGWPTAPDGPFAWGYCFKEEIDQSFNYCDTSNTQYPCVPGKSYFGRGPIQLSWNFNYGPAGEAIGFDGLGDPDLVAQDPLISFKAAIWFWMTPQPPKPSCHDVMTGRYKTTDGRPPGYGIVTNIINGGIECGPANNPGGQDNASQKDRIGFFQRYTSILDVSTGPYLSCTNQSSF